MSFAFEWPTFSEGFYEDARQVLEQALNKGTKPPIIADRIVVKELNMGTLPPDLEILEIGDLSTDRFRGIFRLTYVGDAYIVLQTKVQANPLNVPRPSLDILDTPRILFAAAPLVVPMTLRLSNLSLRAIVVLVVSRQKGITLVFKNDPLESVNVSSSFDGVESVAGYIQKEIEGQLREAFRSDLPGVIHRLSQKWLSGEVKSATQGPSGPKAGEASRAFGKDAKIETRTAYTGDASGKVNGRGLTTKMSSMSVAGESVSMASDVDGETSYSARSFPTSYSRSPPARRLSVSKPPPIHDYQQSVPDSIESYDPTYGLRPDSIPMHAGFGDYERFVKSAQTGKGLGDLLESSDEEADSSYEHDDPSFDMIGLGDLLEDGSGARVPHWDGAPRMQMDDYGSRYSFDSQGGSSIIDGYETIPAVGGGTITRPRIFHTQSQIRTRTVSNGSLSAHGSPSTTTARAPSNASTVGTSGRPRAFVLNSIPSATEHQAGASTSGSSTARFPFPKHQAGSPMPMRSGLATSLRSSTLRQMPLMRSMSSSSTSPETTRRSSSLFPSTLPSSYSSPPSSVRSPREEDADCEPEIPRRQNALDLLSRSPSSILHTTILDENLPITLNPNGSDACAHLATLTSSNQTLSPFTRMHEHFTARSSPHVVTRMGPGLGRGLSSSLASNSRTREATGTPLKAVRKRVHRFGAAASPTPCSPATTTARPTASGSSEASGSAAPSEMSDYFPHHQLGSMTPLGNLRRQFLERSHSLR